MKKNKNHFIVIGSVYLLILITTTLSPYAVTTMDSYSFTRILFFETLLATNLFFPFALNTLYLIVILYKFAWKDQCAFPILHFFRTVLVCEDFANKFFCVII